MKKPIIKINGYRKFLKIQLLKHLWLIPSVALLITGSGCNQSDDGDLPEISTIEVFDVNDTEVTGGGIVTTPGSSKIVAMGVCFTDSEDAPTVEDDYVAAGQYTHNGIEEDEWEFEVPVTGLTPLTTYTIRAYAANESGVAYGEAKTFTTKAGKTFHALTPSMIETFTQEATEGPKEGLVDGNTNTFWHSSWSADVHPLPHHIQINFNEPKSIGGIQYWHRSPSGVGGRPTSFDLQTSDDGELWTTVWESEKDLPVDILPPSANNLMLDKNYTSQHFRIRILTTQGNTTFTYLSGIKVYHDGLLD